MPRKSVIHLIPANTIGGVELAAASIPSGHHGSLDLEKYFLASNPPFDNPESEDCYGPRAGLNSPKVYLSAIRRILATKPDLVVASLWRCVVVLIICKLLRPSLKTVVFLHSTSTAHATDRIINAIGIRLATQIWTDSTATRDARLEPRFHEKSRVVSFLLDRRTADQRPEMTPDFIFWGRLRTPKNIPRSIALFKKIRDKIGQATFRIIGPDGGDETNIATSIRNSGLEDCVKILGPKDHAQIAEAARTATFYLQTSNYEGMSMSVVEAMQSGLIPLVTPVGEIAHYCQDGVNAVFIEDDDRAVDAITALIDNPDNARAMAKAATDTWREAPLYREDFLRLSRAMLD
tara:strand:+ start:15573 stop:16616 length:1044 start_codon:yes stop_codon:yes gene_type:complete